MKTFVYRGFDRDGTRRKGVLEAHDVKDAREKLARGGVFPEEIDAAASDSLAASVTTRGHSLRQINVRAEFYRALAALLKAGIPLSAAFEVMIDHPAESSVSFTRELASIRDRVRDGTGFVHALENAGTAITPFESAVLESGERTGRMPDVLTQVADYLEDVNQVQQTLRTACVYPFVIILLAAVVGIGVLGFLVPQMSRVFEESGMQLPLITRAVVGLGQWFLPVVLPMLLMVSLAAVLMARRIRASERLRCRVEQLLARMPVIRNGFHLLVTTRFSRTCALLLNGGVPLVDAMELAGRATGSVWIAGLVGEKAASVRQGQAFSAAVAEIPVLGKSLPSWVRAGEASGDLAGLFHHVSERNRQLWSNYVQRAVNVIEPALIVIVAVFVLLVALAILLPILSLNRQIG